MFVYLDNSSTTKQYDEVTEEMLKYMTKDFGNPSSLHTLGMTAEKAVKTARRQMAEGMGCRPEEICFTSGGTEADNAAVFGAARARKRIGNKVIISDVEHPAMEQACRRLTDEGFEVVFIPVDDKCRVDIEQLKRELDDNTIFISVMHVNNEVGTIEPIEEIAAIKDDFNKKSGRAKNTEILLHTDAVQSFGKLAEVSRLAQKGVDMISVSGHKIHGPKGIGALYVSGGITVPPFIVGGGQERNMRSGTENVPAIAGLGKAAEIAMTDFDKSTAAMKEASEYLLAGIRSEIKDIKINSPEDRCSSVLNVSFLGTRGEVILHSLEEKQIYVSTGSACSSNKKGRSHVLGAMGLSDNEIEGALRFSFGGSETTEEMNYVLENLKVTVNRFRKLGSFR